MPSPKPVPKGALSPQPRQRALAGVEAEIARAEATRTRRLGEALELEATGRDGSRVRGLLGIVEQRLAQLEQSREVLLRGEEGRGREARAPAPGSAVPLRAKALYDKRRPATVTTAGIGVRFRPSSPSWPTRSAEKARPSP
jgi:hypothetical protein